MTSDFNPFIFDIPVPTEEGYFVSEKHARIAELISEYDPTLSLAWIPPDKRDPGDKPFAVIHRPLGGVEYVVCYADDCDERLLARVYEMDRQGGNALESIDAHNKAVRELQQKKAMEEMQEAHELSASILRSPKSVYRHNGKEYR